ncbi:MAG: UvrD-helicase domain-containing protein [Patescibacteria group bacterium]
MDYLEGLNERQKEAVLHEKGPLLIVAGAGAGKTKTITHRIFHLIKNGVAPESILAITFTNKAAKEMGERLKSLMEQSGSALWRGDHVPHGTWVSTFHALGVRLIKENLAYFNLPKFFQIIDKEESVKLVKQALKESGENIEGGIPQKIASTISKQKNLMRSPDDYLNYANASNDFFISTTVNAWKKYEALKKATHSLDFDDLLLKSTLLLRDNPERLKIYQARWQFIHIDEYQDTNAVQYTLSRLLAGERKNICVVGDVDQSIYSWRGADFTNILRFEEDYPEAKVVTLEENYRSTQVILDFANQVIVKNKKRKEKKLFTRQKGGEEIALIVGIDEGEEASLVAEASRNLIESGAEAKDIGILYRANYQSRALEEAFLNLRIPYQVVGTRFFDRQEIKDVLSLLKCALNPEDIESTKRALGALSLGIGKVTIAKIFSNLGNTLPKTAQIKVANFRALQAEIRKATDTHRPSELIKFIVKRSSLGDKLAESKDEQDKERLENIKELVTLAKRYDSYLLGEGLEQMLTDTALIADQDTIKDGGGVKLMTVHAAKGLEFDFVFVTGLEQDLFPSAPRMGEESERDNEEERRLFYVAITRAKKKLYLCYAESRTIFGKPQPRLPSEFLADLDQKSLDKKQSGWLIDF